MTRTQKAIESMKQGKPWEMIRTEYKPANEQAAIRLWRKLKAIWWAGSALPSVPKYN